MSSFSTDHILSPLARPLWCPEVLQLVIMFLAPFPADLWRFARTFRSASIEARKYLYHDLYFSSAQEEEGRDRVYHILRSQTLARRVRKVTLYTHDQHRGTDWFPYSLLSFNCWPRLESIEVIGSPFDYSNEFGASKESAVLQTAFESALTTGRPAESPLKTFIFRSLDQDPFPRTTFRLPLGLQRIEIERATTDVFPFSLAKGMGCTGNNNVAGSITHICLKGLFNPHHSAFLEILGCSFFSLSTFETGSPSVPLNAESKARLTAFLVKHIGIRRLSLASWDHPASVQPAAIELDPDVIPDKAGFLPSLDEFQGTATQFLSFFLKLGSSSFKRRLRKISLVSSPSGVDAVRTALNDTELPVLDTVRALSLNFVPDHTHAQFATRGQEGHGQTSLVLRDCIGGFGRLCPNVTYFRGNIPIMHLNELSHLLQVFDRITILDLPIRTLGPYLRQRRDEGVASLMVLARSQDSLSHIIGRPPTYSQEGPRVFAVSRVYSNRRRPLERDLDVTIAISDCKSVEDHPISEWEAGYTDSRAVCGNDNRIEDVMVVV